MFLSISLKLFKAHTTLGKAILSQCYLQSQVLLFYSSEFAAVKKKMIKINNIFFISHTVLEELIKSGAIGDPKGFRVIENIKLLLGLRSLFLIEYFR